MGAVIDDFSMPHTLVMQLLPAGRGASAPWPGAVISRSLLPTDPVFYASLTLANIIAGSRYRITRTSTGAELAAGLVAGTGLVDQVIPSIPAYSNPMQVTITVRNASGSPKYKVFDTGASLVAAGASAYILQQLDE